MPNRRDLPDDLADNFRCAGCEAPLPVLWRGRYCGVCLREINEEDD